MKVATLVFVARLSAGAVTYVDADAAGANDGTSWADAFTDLESALAAAASGDEIWIAEGTYLPTVESVVGLPRSKTFALVGGVGLYGGFAGTEALRSERDWTAHETVLSGDIGGAGVTGDNAYHVVIGASDATLDGLTVTEGNANGPDPGWKGGGMYNDAVSGLTVANCTFSANLGDGWGGGLYIENYSTATITNCAFTGNTAPRGAGMYNRDSSPVITDCTFSNNVADPYAAGMLNWGDSYPVITNCVFSDNTAYFSAGMYNLYSHPTIVDCTFLNNTATLGYGGAIRSWDSVTTIRNCRFFGNEAPEGGAIDNWHRFLTVENCVFSGNTADFGGAVMNRFSSTSLTNCTFSGNTALHGGAVYSGESSVTVTNCVLSGDSAFGGDEICDGPESSSTVTQSCVGGGEAGTGNIDADPLFVDADGADDTPGTPDDDLRLQAGSPCIDAADGDAAPATDMDGNPRHDDTGLADSGTGNPTHVDMGAYEFQGTTTGEQLSVRNPPAGVLLLLGTDLEIRWLATGSVSDVKIELSRDGGTSWVAIAASTPNDRSHFRTVTDGGQAMPQPDCLVRISDAADGVPAGTSGLFAIFDGVLRVDADAPGPAHDGFSWATAFLHPQDAADAASEGTEIRVAEGTYVRPGSETVVVTMKDGVAVYGGYAGLGQPDPDVRDPAAHVTTLDGEDVAYHVVIGASNATLDGFAVTGGNASTSVTPDDRGAGMYNHSVAGLTVTGCTFAGNGAYRSGGGMSNTRSSVDVTECVFSGNSADISGGGIFNDVCSPNLTGCTFSGNSAGNGGGMYGYRSSPTVTNCTFSGNAADWGGGGMYGWDLSSPTVANCTFSGNTAGNDGGAMYNYWTSSPAVTSCTFSNNVAASSGGAIRNGDDSSPSVTNCILWGDSAPTGPEIDNDGTSSCTVSYSDVDQAGGFVDGGGNINADPLFLDADGADDVAGTLDDDLRLQAGSPCIDAADGDAAPATDMDGNPRHDDPGTPDTGLGAITCADMGACELQTGSPCVPPPPVTPFGGGCGSGAGAALAFCILAFRRKRKPPMNADARR